MKNLHILPTDKPSRLFKANQKLFFDNINPSTKCITAQHIYITSDEEIKTEDWYLDTTVNVIFKNDKLFLNGTGYKKIILTTDQDLIKEGVQAIDDEFLEWFVKNTSCEWVEVEDTCLEVRVCDCTMNENCLKPGYTIIIPQEELNLNCFDCNKSLQDCTCMEDTINMKQETLEEVATKVLDRKYPYHRPTDAGYWKDMFISGANYQAERMYSKEDFKLFARQFYREIKLDKSNLLWDDLADKCLEQFKKK
jgi:hypothetical protein